MILEKKGYQIKAPTGFSWTNLFFGMLVPLCRSDLKGFGIQLAFFICTGGISQLVIPFTYNKAYIKRLKMKGFIEV